MDSELWLSRGRPPKFATGQNTTEAASISVLLMVTAPELDRVPTGLAAKAEIAATDIKHSPLRTNTFRIVSLTNILYPILHKSNADSSISQITSGYDGYAIERCCVERHFPVQSSRLAWWHAQADILRLTPYRPLLSRIFQSESLQLR